METEKKSDYDQTDPGINQSFQRKLLWLGLPTALITALAATYLYRDKIEEIMLVAQTRSTAQHQAHASAEFEKKYWSTVNPSLKVDFEGPCGVRKVRGDGGSLPYFRARKIDYGCGHILVQCSRSSWYEQFDCVVKPMWLTGGRSKKK